MTERMVAPRQHGVYLRATSRRMPIAMPIAVAIFGVLLGLAVAVLPPSLLAMVTAALLVPTLLVVWVRSRAAVSRDWLFAFILLGLLVLPFLGRVSGISFGTGWQALLLLLGLLGLPRLWADMRESVWLKVAFACFVGFLLLAVVSTFLGQSKWRAAAFQFVSDLKPLVLIALGYALLWDQRCERWLSSVLAWAWLPMALMVAFEWAAPSVYRALTIHNVTGVSVEPSLYFPSRALGIFEHPAQLAGAAACFAMLVFSRLLTDKARRLRNSLLFLVYFALVVCAVQRQELAALMVAIVVIAAVHNPSRLLRNVVILSLLGIAAVVALVALFPEVILNELAKWGYGTVGPVNLPRAQIFAGAWTLAQQHFPLGAGLGTYAGAGSEKFDLSTYSDLGFGRYWWFGKRDYLLDTYWPNSLGETGVLGASMLLAAYVSLLAHALLKVGRLVGGIGHGYAIAAVGGTVYMLLVSLTSPSFQDPRLFVIPAILYGITAHLSSKRPQAGDV